MITFDPTKVTIGNGIHIGAYADTPAWFLPELIPKAQQITTNPFLDMSFGAGGANQIWVNPTNGYGIQGGTIHASMDDIQVGWKAYDAATDTQYGVVTAVSGQTGFADGANRYITLSVSGFSTGLDWYFVSAAVESGGGGAGGGSVVLNISGISGTTVPDTSGSGYNGTLVGTHSTGSDSHGAYVYLNNNGYINISGYNLSRPFTVRMIQAIDSSQQFWSSMWGNESWFGGQGYVAYLTSLTNLTVATGGQGSSKMINLTGKTLTNIAQWDFVIDGTNASVYYNGAMIGSATAFADPTGGDATNGLYIGSRHTNAGTGSSDELNTKVYAVNVFDTALSGATIASDFASNQTTFSIP